MREAWESWNETKPAIPSDATVSLVYSVKGHAAAMMRAFGPGILGARCPTVPLVSLPGWPRPDADLLRGEAIAALTVAVVMIPQSVAYAGLAGMPLVTGPVRHLPADAGGRAVQRSTRLSVGPRRSPACWSAPR
jgi:hypothetical protein